MEQKAVKDGARLFMIAGTVDRKGKSVTKCPDGPQSPVKPLQNNHMRNWGWSAHQRVEIFWVRIWVKGKIYVLSTHAT